MRTNVSIQDAVTGHTINFAKISKAAEKTWKRHNARSVKTKEERQYIPANDRLYQRNTIYFTGNTEKAFARLH